MGKRTNERTGESNIIRLDEYRPRPSARDWEEFDLYDAYGRTIADWIWASIFENATGGQRTVREEPPDAPHCEVIYWQFAAGRRHG